MYLTHKVVESGFKARARSSRILALKPSILPPLCPESYFPHLQNGSKETHLAGFGGILEENTYNIVFGEDTE